MNCQFKKGDVTLPAAPLGRQGGIDVRKPFSIALLGFATLLGACSGGTTANAMRAYASRPARILELSMAETNEDIERRSAAIVNGRGRVPLGDYADQVTDRAMECYGRVGN